MICGMFKRKFDEIFNFVPNKTKKRVNKAMFKIISIVIITMLCVSCFV